MQMLRLPVTENQDASCVTWGTGTVFNARISFFLNNNKTVYNTPGGMSSPPCTKYPYLHKSYPFQQRPIFHSLPQILGVSDANIFLFHLLGSQDHHIVQHFVVQHNLNNSFLFHSKMIN